MVAQSEISYQVRRGYSGASLTSIDYTPTTVNDIDPVTGDVDIYNTYLNNTVNLKQLLLPLHARYTLGDASRHFFVAGGVEYRILLSEKYDAEIVSYDGDVTDFNPSPFYSVRSPNLSCHLEIGYEFPWQEKKFNLSLFSKYGVSKLFVGEGKAFGGLYQGHAIDIGVSAGFIF